jgi:translocon-associated protein subunit gamma
MINKGLFWRIHQMEPTEYYIYFIIGVLISTYLIARSYINVKHLLKFKVLQKREHAVSLEVNAKLQETDKKLSKQDKDERIEWTRNQVADYESTTFSIFYNNSLFLFILLIASFLIFKNLTPQL